MLFFTASEDAVNYLTVTFAVDFDLDDPSLSWHAQCAAQVSGDLFFVRGQAWTKNPSPTEDKGKGKEKKNVGLHRHRPIPTSSYAAEMSQPPLNDITHRRTQDMPGPSQKPDRLRCYQPKNSRIQAAAQLQQIERLKTPQRKPDYEAHSMPSDPSGNVYSARLGYRSNFWQQIYQHLHPRPTRRRVLDLMHSPMIQSNS